MYKRQVLAHPEGYEVMSEVEDIAIRNAKESGGTFTKTNNMAEAFKNCLLYTSHFQF